MSDLSKMEVKECPFCGKRMEWREAYTGQWRWSHPLEGDGCGPMQCIADNRELWGKRGVELWNRRAPPRELVEAWERLSHAIENWGGTTVINGDVVGELMVMAQTVKKLCEVGK